MAGKLWNIRLDDETRGRWEAAAKRRGLSLAEFVRRGVENEIASGERDGWPEPKPSVTVTAPPRFEKKSYRPDPRPSGKK